MARSFDIAVFEGDEIGPEIIAPTVSILQHLAREASTYGLTFTAAEAGAGLSLRTKEALP